MSLVVEHLGTHTLAMRSSLTTPRAEQGRRPVPPVRRDGLPGLLALQRAAGNRAVAALLAPAVAVQRCGSERHEGCPCAETAEPESVQRSRTDAPVQRKVDEKAFEATGGRIEEVGDTTGGGFGEGSTESNEFLLWNYRVGRPEPRAQHTTYLTDKVLGPGRWPDMLRADKALRVAVVGGASSTGGAAVATPLSGARADRVRASLVSGGIAAGRVVTSGVGSRHPFADETSSENMARNRRVEVFLFRPAKRVAALAGVSVTASNLSAAVPVGFSRDTSNPNLLVLRWRPFVFTADVVATGPPDLAVGILQFLRADSRIGGYRSGAGSFLLDFGRCMQPDLPCKDVAESRGRFSGPGQVNGPGAGTVRMADSPGFVMPIKVADPRRGTLVSSHWEMEFVAVIGAYSGDRFLPVKSVVWSLADDHAVDATGALNPTSTAASAQAPQDGAPADLDVEQAMSGRTCRFTARRMNDFCRPELA
ncbi:OmpA family protein [Amycolatopsis pretoriensis]|uniref:OmpA family protein n=2 Tax=Amycolatopsis pretoriensis TaxID=218821 RepID=A0A1H5RGX1_9PSEU|nr:OmpA family protein [Amycolatopsis pretoriensis]